MHGLAILTYVNRPGLGLRLQETLRTLELSRYTGRVFVVDDGSPCRPIPRMPVGVQFVRRAENGGVSRGKNTCLRLLADLGVDVGFLADDDVDFKPNWWKPYLKAHRATGVAHFSWAAPKGESTELAIRGHVVRRVEHLNGLLLSFTPEVVQKVGGFPVSPVKWGYDHCPWTNRIVAAKLAPCPLDVRGSEDLIAVNRFGGESAVALEQRQECRRYEFERVGPIYQDLVE